MNQSMKKRLKALEGQITPKDKTITAIDRQIVNPDGTYTGDILRTDLLSKKTVEIFDPNLKGKVCVVGPKVDDEGS